MGPDYLAQDTAKLKKPCKRVVANLDWLASKELFLKEREDDSQS